MGGDTVELHRMCDHVAGICDPEIYRVRTIAASGQISMVKISDGRMKKEILEAKEWWSPSVNSLRQLECRKVMIDFLGRKRYAND